MRRAVVVCNPVAGRGRARDASERACRTLEARGVSVERRETTGPAHATALAREAVGVADLVVVAGGDGSVREAIVGLGDAAERVPVAVLPVGNANVLARELQIPLNVDGAADVLAHGAALPIDVGVVEDETFLAMVGVGWDARTTHLLALLRRTRLGGAWYRAWPDSVYFAAGLAALCTGRPNRLRLAVDGRACERDYCAVLVANQATYGKGWKAVPEASLCDGRLGYQARKRAGLPFVAWQLHAARRHRRVPAFVSDYGSAERVEISADRAFPFHVDGDFRGWRTSLSLRVRPGAARVLAPVQRAAPALPPMATRL